MQFGGRQLGIVEALMDSGEEFEGEAEPGLAGEDGVRGVEGRGEGLADASEAMKCDTGRVGVRDVVVVEGVGDDNGSGTFITREEEAEVIEWEEVGGEARVWKSEEVVEGVGVAHGRREEWKQWSKERVVRECRGSKRRRDRK